MDQERKTEKEEGVRGGGGTLQLKLSVPQNNSVVKLFWL